MLPYITYSHLNLLVEIFGVFRERVVLWWFFFPLFRINGSVSQIQLRDPIKSRSAYSFYILCNVVLSTLKIPGTRNDASPSNLTPENVLGP